jgi:hypothetical protein
MPGLAGADPAELLPVDVDQLARAGSLVAAAGFEGATFGL